VYDCGLCEKIKHTCTSWLKEQGREFYDFSWLAGYGVFTINISHLEKLVAYVENQEEHHMTVKFQKEYRGQLRKNGIIVDETHLWDGSAPEDEASRWDAMRCVWAVTHGCTVGMSRPVGTKCVVWDVTTV
jgi:hypothetical protein